MSCDFHHVSRVRSHENPIEGTFVQRLMPIKEYNDNWFISSFTIVVYYIRKLKMIILKLKTTICKCECVYAQHQTILVILHIYLGTRPVQSQLSAALALALLLLPSSPACETPYRSCSPAPTTYMEELLKCCTWATERPNV